ncbi:nucleotide sugar dehydrogenase, partial [Candidatus Sumerlaeota bacterium]|nr:nucleotide sugar dehydrogenase [Candidatus Sumerlaeota bacterium]
MSPKRLPPVAKNLLERIKNRQITSGVVGLGYVGLPLVLLINRKGFRTLGFDIDQRKIASLKAGRSYIGHFDNAAVASLAASGRFDATADLSRTCEADTLSICLPTPLDRNMQPDLSAITNTLSAMAPHFRPGQLIILESTTYPGTTDEVVKPIIESGGLKVGHDIFLAFSPEREDPGNKAYPAERIPKVVGAVTLACLELALAYYGALFERVIPVSNCRTAELTKLLENIYRCVNIALVNELKLLCQRMGINIWEVIEAASTKPFGFHPFYPGPGLGGHCIPIDPFYLSWKAREYDFTTRFIELAGEINTAMPYKVVERTVEALGERGRAAKGAKILVLGVAYKKNVDDIRESPALKVIQLLKQRGAQISYYDPHVPFFRSERHGELPARSLNALTPGAVRWADAVLILTDHDAVDYDAVVRHAHLVVDTR